MFNNYKISSFETPSNKAEHSLNHGVSDFQKIKSNPPKKAIVMKLIKTSLWLYLIIFKGYTFLRGVCFHIFNCVRLQYERASCPDQMCVYLLEMTSAHIQ